MESPVPPRDRNGKPFPPKAGYRLAAAMRQKGQLNKPFFDMIVRLAEEGKLVSAAGSGYFLAMPDALLEIQTMANEIGIAETGEPYVINATPVRGPKTLQAQTANGKYDISAYPHRVAFKDLSKPLGDSRTTMDLNQHIPHPPLTEAGKEMRARETGPARLMR